MTPELRDRIRANTAARRQGEARPGLAERVAAALACRYKGQPTGETRECKACGSRTAQVPLLACSLHVACTERRLVPQVACCKVCPDRAT